MNDPFFGELYLRTTRPFLSNAVTEEEARYLARAFEALPVEGPIADLGCGHGRHAAALNPLGGRPVIGFELEPLSLQERLPGFDAVRADLRRLPCADASLAGAFAWYSTLFGFPDEEIDQVLAEAARALKPGGRLVLHTVAPERARSAPPARFEQPLPEGGRVRERSHFDPRTQRDVGERELLTADGRTLRATFTIRSFRPEELRQVLDSQGFSLEWMHGGLDGSPLHSTSTDWIIGAGRTHD